MTYGAAGGFIGHDYLVYISSVLSHAPGIFSLVVTESVVVATAVDLVAGQSATMAATGADITWSYSGSGAGFLIGAGASLGITGIAVAAASGLAFRLDAGATLSGNPRLGSGPITCEALVAGIGTSALDCATDAAAGLITLAGPTFVSSSGSALPLGSGKYLGDVLTDWTDAVYTHEVGVYPLNVAADISTSTAVPVAASMHVSVLGGAESQPSWRYTGKGAAFSVAAAGFLTLDCLVLHNPVTVDGGSLT
jgi:hypothetical protein